MQRPMLQLVNRESNVADRIIKLKGRAENGPIGKKRSSFELYALLADCMQLAHECKLNPADRAALIEMLKPEGYGKGRSRKGQVNYNSSEYQLVCRFVFQHKGTSAKADASNASRYGKALDEAARRGILPSKIEEFLRESGGINALFLARPLKAIAVTTRAIRLAESTTLPKDGEVTLTLRRRPDGSFDVVRNSYDLSHDENRASR
jgi:hypothetical protein